MICCRCWLRDSPGVHIFASFGCSVPTVEKRHENWTSHGDEREKGGAGGGEVKLNTETRGKSPDEP